MFTRALFLLFLIAYNLPRVVAVEPDWWVTHETRILEEPNGPGAVSENYAPVNLGQLKHVALQAQAHLNNNLAEGLGFSVDESWPDIPVGENYTPINVGQLKAVAKPFYDRLIEVGYDTRQNLIQRGYPADWSFDYPWPPEVPLDENYAMANIGQLKVVFSFDLSDFEEDGGEANPLPEWWQLAYFGTTEVDPNDDADGDGQSNFQEYLAGTDPTTPDHPPPPSDRNPTSH